MALFSRKVKAALGVYSHSRTCAAQRSAYILTECIQVHLCSKSTLFKENQLFRLGSGLSKEEAIPRQNFKIKLLFHTHTQMKG